MEPREFPCMDDDPRNNGNGYSQPNPYDDFEDTPDEEEITEEAFWNQFDEPEN